MRAFFRRVRTFARASVRLVLRVIRLTLILSLVFMPLPVTALLAVVLAGDRREFAAEVIRQE
jgi:hypothetical protein